MAAGGIAAALVLGACDFPGTGTGSDSGQTEAEKTRIAEEWRDCLAKGGLEGEISDDGSEISIGFNSENEMDEMDEELLLEIETECESILAGYEGATDPELSPEEQAQLADGMVEVQRCLAEQGYEVSATANGIDMNDEGQQSEDFDEAVYNEAEETCIKTAMPELWAKYGEN